MEFHTFFNMLVIYEVLFTEIYKILQMIFLKYDYFIPFFQVYTEFYKRMFINKITSM